VIGAAAQLLCHEGKAGVITRYHFALFRSKTRQLGRSGFFGLPDIVLFPIKLFCYAFAQFILGGGNGVFLTSSSESF
jgi:hypothetical protein